MPRTDLTPDQQADADRIHAALIAATVTDLRDLAELLATTTDRTLFGATEFAARDAAHGIAAKALQAAADLRKKRATMDRPEPARGAGGRPGSSGGRPSRS